MSTMRARRLRVLWGTLAFLAVGIPGLVWAARASEESLMIGLAAFMVLGVAWVGGLFLAYSCPRCGESLGTGAMHAANRIEWMLHLIAQPAECPNCGLTEGEEGD